MPQANPLLQVQVKLPARMSVDLTKFIIFLKHANILEHGRGVGEFLLSPPKGTVSNQFWAENVYKYCLTHNIPALIVRPAQNAQEVAS